MATLTGNVLVRHPESGDIVALAAGAELPEWASGLVGEHVLDGPLQPADPPKGGEGGAEDDPPADPHAKRR